MATETNDKSQWDKNGYIEINWYDISKLEYFESTGVSINTENSEYTSLRVSGEKTHALY